MTIQILATAPGAPAFAEFLSAADAVRAGDPTCPPPPADLVAFELSLDAPFRRHGDAQLFVAQQGDRIVGRVVASLDRRQRAYGCFGYFDSVNDEAVARPLIDAALTWLRARDVKRVEGPIQLHALGGYRLQIGGFERRPFLGEPRNPRTYPALITKLGFSEAGTWRTWDFEGWRLGAFKVFHRFQAYRNKRLRRLGFSTVEMDGSNFDKELGRIWSVVMTCYGQAAAFWPLELEEYVRWNAPLQTAPGVRGAMLFHDSEPEPIGFGFGVHNGDRGILHSFGVLPAWRGKGLAHLLYEHSFQEIHRLKLNCVVGALAKEGSTKYDEVGGKPSRRYALYARDTEPLRGA